MNEEKKTPEKKRLTLLGFVLFDAAITFCIYALVNFFVGGIPWPIVLAGVSLALLVFTLK